MRRRRDRDGSDGEVITDRDIAAMPGEILTPTYVTMPRRDWSAESDTPVLELDGLKPWDQIRGPALALEDERQHEAFTLDSHDPTQLEFEPYGVAVAEAAPVTEPEPPADPVDLMYLDARAAAHAGRLAEAREAYQRVVSEQPRHLAARNELAQLLERLGDQDAALRAYDKALELDGEHLDLLTNRGGLLGAMGRYAAAERDLKKVLRSKGDAVDALFHLGVVMARKGLWAEAVPQLRRVIELDPERGPAHFYLGEALNHVDDLYGAMAAYQRAAELMPEHQRSLYGLGIVLDRLGRPDEAAVLYRKSREVGRR